MFKKHLNAENSSPQVHIPLIKSNLIAKSLKEFPKFNVLSPIMHKSSYNIKFKKIVQKIDSPCQQNLKKIHQNMVDARARSTSPAQEINTEEMIPMIENSKTSRRENYTNQINLFHMFQKMEEFSKKQDFFDQTTIEICFDFIHCLIL